MANQIVIIAGNKTETDPSTGISEQVQDKVEKPKLYKVILLNDDFTPMDFVVMILQKIFNKNQEQATQVMLDVHKKGAGTAGIYSLEIAEMKIMQVHQLARQNKYPLKCTMESV